MYRCTVAIKSTLCWEIALRKFKVIFRKRPILGLCYNICKKQNENLDILISLVYQNICTLKKDWNINISRGHFWMMVLSDMLSFKILYFFNLYFRGVE